MAAGRRAHDQRNLRDHPRGQRVAPEDLAVQPEGDDALLDPCAPALVDTDERAPRLDGEVDDLDDLLAVDLAESAAEDRHVLAEDTDGSTMDRPHARDDPVGVRPSCLQAEGRRAVSCELVDAERSFVQQGEHALARGHLASRVLLLDRCRGSHIDGGVDALPKIGDLSLGRVDVDLHGPDLSHFSAGCPRPDAHQTTLWNSMTRCRSSIRMSCAQPWPAGHGVPFRS